MLSNYAPTAVWLLWVQQPVQLSWPGCTGRPCQIQAPTKSANLWGSISWQQGLFYCKHFKCNKWSGSCPLFTIVIPSLRLEAVLKILGGCKEVVSPETSGGEGGIRGAGRIAVTICVFCQEVTWACLEGRMEAEGGECRCKLISQNRTGTSISPRSSLFHKI